jgi:hypothetical protein
VDAKDFYVINEWTDAVARLAEDADPGKPGRVAQKDDPLKQGIAASII